MLLRAGILLVFFDIPSTKRREYTRLKKLLKQNGFVPVQKSVYVKLLTERSGAGQEITGLKKAVSAGSVFALQIGLEQFRKMTAVAGDPFCFERFVEDYVTI